MSPLFSIVHSTCRPKMGVEAACRWLDGAKNPANVEYIFGVDAHDAATQESVKRVAGAKIVVVENPDGHNTKVTNAAALASTGKVLISNSDDFFPPKHWDALLEKAVRDAGKWPDDVFAIAVNDGCRIDNLMTLPILSRARWEAQGRELYGAEYITMYNDNEFTYRAYRDRCVIEARHLLFHHVHPLPGQPGYDKVYEVSNAPEKYCAGHHSFHLRNPEAGERHGEWQKVSQNDEERVIVDYFHNRNETFLDIGAYDGINLSNTWALARLGWSGVLVEASPDCFTRLAKNYIGNPRIQLVSACIGVRAGLAPFWNCDDAYATMNEKETARFRNEPGHFQKIFVPVIPAPDLINQFGKKFALLSIDAEGSDLEILRAMPLDKIEVEMVCAEHNCRPEELEKYFKELGYTEIHRNSENMIVVKK